MTIDDAADEQQPNGKHMNANDKNQTWVVEHATQINTPVTAHAAAQKVADKHNWGAVTPNGGGSAVTFAAGPAFMRVVDANADASGTLATAAFAAAALGCPAPLQNFPEIVELPEGEYEIELYERIDVDPSRKPNMADLGAALAALHAVDISAANLRPQIRTAVSRKRVQHHDPAVQAQMLSLFNDAERALSESTGPLVFCHGDATTTNLVWDRQKAAFTFVDFEYSGLAPSAFDVASTATGLLRFVDRPTSRAFIDSYREAGGQFDPSDFAVLGGIRDLCGAADFSAAGKGTPRAATFQHRFNSFNDLFRSTRW